MGPRFAQVVIGPPGAGKSTYCKAMKAFLETMRRKVAIINLDPANDVLPYDCSLDVSALITVDDAMDNLSLGPNGGLMYCMEYLEANYEWLSSKISQLPQETYLLFDCPGQVELYTHHNSVKSILGKMMAEDYRLCTVHLVDSHYCTEANKFIAVLLTSLTSMLQSETPHVNVLSKVDLIEQYGRLEFNIDFYTEVLDLEELLDTFPEDNFNRRFKKLNKGLMELVQDYSLVSFIPLAVSDEKMLGNVMAQVDKANGYIYGKAEDDAIRQMYSSGAGYEWDKISTVREKYMNLEDEAGDNMDMS